MPATSVRNRQAPDHARVHIKHMSRQLCSELLFAAADTSYMPDDGPEASQGAASDHASHDEALRDLDDDDQEEAAEDAASRLQQR